MPLYVYKAVDLKGKIIKGEMDSSSEMELTTQLAKQGYLPVSVSFKTVKEGFSLAKLLKSPEK